VDRGDDGPAVTRTVLERPCRLVLLIAVVAGLVAGSWTIFEWGDRHSSVDRWRRRR